MEENSFGDFIFPNGEEYSGSYSGFQRSGQGKQLLCNKLIYIGEWKDNKYEGYGRQYNPEFKKFKSISSNIYRNLNLLTNENWKSYIGEFKRGKWHGRGTLLLSNGFKLNGEFYKNRVHGKGSVISQNGTFIVIGEYVHNEI